MFHFVIRRPNIPLLVCALDFADELIHPFTVLETILQTQGLDGSSSYVAKEKKCTNPQDKQNV